MIKISGDLLQKSLRTLTKQNDLVGDLVPTLHTVGVIKTRCNSYVIITTTGEAT